MIITPAGFLDMAAEVTTILLMTGILLGVFRLIRGPAGADRIVALDMISTLVVSLLGVAAVEEGTTVYLDVAIAYALIAFLGTMSLARYLQRHHRQNDRNGERDSA